ncbi:hypothetical protein B6I21_08280 [candidate division KSB1 bacterium 4572_119]|nr:MAG: hypothetical protein B6I21_08280 [candidate division KSB1 bacterium 4572_119]
MKLKKRWLFVIITISLVVIIALFAITKKSGKSKDNGPATIKVERRNIEDKALAIGTIDPRNEIQVKSKISGVVKQLFVAAGDLIEQGEPMVEIRPDPTPLELAQAKRNYELELVALENSKNEYERTSLLKEKGFTSSKDFEIAKNQFDQAKIRTEMAKEKLALLEEGKISIAGKDIETTIKAPATGFILERMTDVGDPIVPLTSYQAGTVLFTLADMKNLLFKGTVDEIDVGKLKEGMSAEIQVGALPGKPVKGTLEKISLKALKQDNTTVFPVEISIKIEQGQVLRAGYSANANIIIMKKDSVLAIPERVVTFRNDSAFVHIPDGENRKEKYIETGLSDALYIEVVSGLKENEEILEKELKEIK